MFARRSPGVTPHAAIHITPSVGTAEAADTAARPGWRQHAQPQQDTTFDLEIDADPDIGKAPLTVQFAAVIEVDLPEPLTYHWDFGDGGQDGSNPTRHTYLQAGEYTAMLTAVSGDGRVGTRDVVIQVDPREEDDAAAD
jgi:PKD repeat protein